MPTQHGTNTPHDTLRLISTCPLCNTQYNPLSAKVLEEREDAHLVHIQCRRCESSIVAVVVMGGVGVSSIGLITDLTSEDVLRFKDVDALSGDELLAMYQTFGTDLFAQELLQS